MTESLTDSQLRARTEQLLTEALNIATQLKIQTERLSDAIDNFQLDVNKSDRNRASRD